MATIRYRSPGAEPQPRTLPQTPSRRGAESAWDDNTQEPAEDPAKADRWWRESSYDLMRGLEVSEDPGDTLPGDLADALFRP